MSELQYVPVGQIEVRQRVREDVGNIAELAASIQELGLLAPIVVRPKPENGGYVLVAGMRRLEAMTAYLGWEIVPALIVHNLQDERRALRAELSENSQRLALSPFEMVQRAAQLLQGDWDLSEERSGTGQSGLGRDPANPKALLTAPPPAPPRDTDRWTDRWVAAALGMGYRQFRNAREIVHAAEEQPDRYADLAMELHVSRNIAGTFRHYVHRKHEYEQQQLREAPTEERPALVRGDPLAWLARQSPLSCDLMIADPPHLLGYGETRAFAERWVSNIPRLLRPTARAYVFVGASPHALAAYVDALRECLLVRHDLVIGNMLVWAWRNTSGPPPRRTP